MGDIREAFPSSYLKSADIGDRRVNVTIDRVEMEEMPDDGKTKPVLYFRGKERGLVLNVTNSNTLGESYGYMTEEWAGQICVLFTVDTEFGGRRTKGIRIDAPKPVSDFSDEALSDDLPF